MTAPAQSAGAGATEPERGHESEWQLSTGDLGVVRRWLTAHSAVERFTIEPRPAQTIYDTYLDTEDWRVHRAGFALRLRDLPGEAEATLKDLAPGSNGYRHRREFNQRLRAADEQSLRDGSGPVSARVQAVAGGRPLRPLFRVRTDRQRFAVLDQDAPAGEIALDETIVASIEGRSKAQMRRVEVEALAASPQALQGLVERIRSECALHPVLSSKYEAGLQASGLETPDPFKEERLAIDPSQRVAEVARANLLRELSSWLACEPGARLGENLEQLHDMRVAGRRLDAMMRLFAGHLPRPWNRLRSRLKALIEVLGAVRDLDVRLLELNEFAQELEPADRQGLEPLRSWINHERGVARDRMIRMLDRPSTQRVFQRFRTDLSQLTSHPADADNPIAATIAPALIRERYKKVRRQVSRLHGDSTADDYHRVRRRVKRLRYAIDAFEGFYGSAADEFHRALRGVQNTLGSQQDAAVSAERIKLLIVGAPALPGASLFLMGIFFEQRRRIAGEMRTRFSDAYRKISGRRWKALRRAMKELAGAHPDRTEKSVLRT